MVVTDMPDESACQHPPYPRRGQKTDAPNAMTQMVMRVGDLRRRFDGRFAVTVEPALPHGCALAGAGAISSRRRRLRHVVSDVPGDSHVNEVTSDSAGCQEKFYISIKILNTESENMKSRRLHRSHTGETNGKCRLIGRLEEGMQLSKQSRGDAADHGVARKTGPATVKPVANAIAILRYLSDRKARCRVTEIATELGINTSTCFGILRTLVAQEVLAFDEQTKNYSIGLGIVQLAARALSADGRLDIVRPHLQRVADDFEVSMTIWSLSTKGRSTLIEVVQHSSNLQIQMRIGQRVPVLLGAIGRLYAPNSKLSKAEVRAGFETLRWAVPLSFDVYWRQCLTAQKKGWALDEHTFARGVTSIAVPVGPELGSMTHALVATTFYGRHETDGLQRIADALMKLSDEIAPIF